MCDWIRTTASTSLTNLEGGVHTTSGIRNEERLNAQLVHDTNREGNLLHVVTLVVVETTLHSHDVHATKLTEDEGTSVSLYGRYGEVGYLAVGNLELVSYFGS